MSKSSSRRARRRARRQRRQWRNIAIFTLIGVAVFGGLLWVSNRPSLPDGKEIATPAEVERPYADGKALGAADAPVVIEEFSDFQ